MRRHVTSSKVGVVRGSEESLQEAAYRIIKERILRKELRSGDPVVEAKLAKELGMSRARVRDALNRLQQDGLVTFVQNKGFFVETFSPVDVAEIYDMREVVEGLAARLLARRITPQMAESLRELAETADSRSATVADDVAFHAAIIRMCGSRRVAEAARVLSLNVLAYDEIAHRLTSDGPAPLLGRGIVPDTHRLLADKIISGTPDVAEEEARKHVRLGKTAAARFMLGLE